MDIGKQESNACGEEQQQEGQAGDGGGVIAGSEIFFDDVAGQTVSCGGKYDEQCVARPGRVLKLRAGEENQGSAGKADPHADFLDEWNTAVLKHVEAEEQGKDGRKGIEEAGDAALDFCFGQGIEKSRQGIADDGHECEVLIIHFVDSADFVDDEGQEAEASEPNAAESDLQWCEAEQGFFYEDERTPPYECQSEEEQPRPPSDGVLAECMAPSTHRGKLLRLEEGFDFVDFDGDVCGEVDGFVFGDEDVVFEAYAEIFFADVDGGFAGEHHAGL